MQLKSIVLVLCIALLATNSVSAKGITVGLQLEPPGLDPTAGAAAAIDEIMYANVFESLTRYNEDGSIRPALAKNWEISADGTRYTFFLQEDVTFHDGSPMTAADVKFSLDRAMAEDTLNAQKQLFASISNVAVLNDLTVEIRLAAPNSGFLVNMAWPDAAILSANHIDTMATAPIGTGPMKFSRWVPGDRVELVRNDAYWGTAIALERATFKFISDPTAAFAAMMSGDIDVFPGFPAVETLPQFANNPRFKVSIGSTEGETILAMNNRDEALSDMRVRKAITHAIDRAELIEGAVFGYGIPIATHFPPHNPNYVDMSAYSPYDPELAKQLLAAAGYAPGELTLQLKLGPASYMRRGGEIIAAMLNAVGIRTEISKLEWSLWLEQVFLAKDYDLTVVAHVEPDDLGIYGNPDYYFQYDNPQVAKLMTEVTQTLEADARAAKLAAVQEIIAADYVNVYLFQYGRTGVAKAEIQGLWTNFPTQVNDLTGVSWP